MKTNKIYQFYAELKDFSPKIWRRFQMEGSSTMAELGYVIMTLFEMKASHLFNVKVHKGESLVELLKLKPNFDMKQFMKENPSILDIRYEYHIDQYDLGIEEIKNSIIDRRDARKHTLYKTNLEMGEILSLNYDYGDDWMIRIKLEEIVDKTEESNVIYPILLKGKGYGIIEDCGGVMGLKELVKAFKDKNGEQYENYQDWLQIESFDIHVFNLEEMNERIHIIPRIYKDIYELKKYISDAEINLIERRNIKA